MQSHDINSVIATGRGALDFRKAPLLPERRYQTLKVVRAHLQRIIQRDSGVQGETVAGRDHIS